MSDRYDIVVIGGGPGGYSAAIRAAHQDLSVAIVEEDRLGGTCLNRGCIPTKALIASSSRFASLATLEEHGISVKSQSFSYGAMASRKDRVVEAIVSSLEKLVAGNGITVVTGRGRIVDGGTAVEVALTDGGTQRLEAGTLIIATGSRTACLPFITPDHEHILFSDDLLKLTELPASLTIIGGGVIGCEWASILADLGCNVTIVELMPTLLPGMDRMAANLVKRSLKSKGVTINTKVCVTGVSVDGNYTVTTLESGEDVRSERTLVCVGRSCNTEDLGLEEAGVELEKGHIVVDRFLRTDNDHIFAVGDVVGGLMLAHKASWEGEVAVHNILHPDEMVDATDALIPSVVFTSPEIAMFGRTENELKAEDIAFRAGRFSFAANGKSLCSGESDGFVKVLVGEDGCILGAIIVGPDASSLIPSLLVPTVTGVTVELISDVVFPHPTLGEAVKEAVDDAQGRALYKTAPKR